MLNNVERITNTLGNSPRIRNKESGQRRKVPRHFLLKINIYLTISLRLRFERSFVVVPQKKDTNNITCPQQILVTKSGIGSLSQQAINV